MEPKLMNGRFDSARGTRSRRKPVAGGTATYSSKWG